ncbi:MAG TPA: hypothetical protein VK508_12040 [Cyclobacteriaceae bacterium]|nr:hypothetical protein [Cyclobacteriaceae bacterium]
MRIPLAIATVLFLITCTEGYSQQARHTTLKRSPKNKSLRAPSISKAKSRVICPIFEQSQYPYQGLGIKLGDPVALSYKYYPNKHWAFGADVGKVASGLYSKYYRKKFEVDYLPDTLQGEESIKQLSHRAITDWYLEAKFLYQWNAENISPGLQLYAGLGWQWRNTKLEYDYIYEDGLFETELGKFRRSRFTYGPSAIVGFEYSYFSLPLSAFIEIEWFTDALLDPGYNRFQGGVGLRYIF